MSLRSRPASRGDVYSVGEILQWYRADVEVAVSGALCREALWDARLEFEQRYAVNDRQEIVVYAHPATVHGFFGDLMRDHAYYDAGRRDATGRRPMYENIAFELDPDLPELQWRMVMSIGDTRTPLVGRPDFRRPDGGPDEREPIPDVTRPPEQHPDQAIPHWLCWVPGELALRLSTCPRCEAERGVMCWDMRHGPEDRAARLANGDDVHTRNPHRERLNITGENVGDTIDDMLDCLDEDSRLRLARSAFRLYAAGRYDAGQELMMFAMMWDGVIEQGEDPHAHLETLKKAWDLEELP